MEKIKTIKEGANKLLNKLEITPPEYEVILKSREENVDHVHFADGKQVPLFWWRCHEKYETIKNSFLKQNKGTECCINGHSFTTVDETLNQLVYREIDLCEWLLCSKTKKVTAFKTGDAMSCIFLMENGTTANMDFGATMPSGAQQQSLHRLITTTGMASDRVVDNVIVQNAIHVFADNPKPDCYTDLELWLYGLKENEVNSAVFVFELLKGDFNPDDYIKLDNHIKKVMEATYNSVKYCKTCEVED